MRLKRYFEDKRLVHVLPDDVRDGTTGVITIAIGATANNPLVTAVGVGMVLHRLVNIIDREDRRHFLDSQYPIRTEEITKDSE